MKNKKIRNIIIFAVLAVLAVVYSVFYILYPEATKQVTADVLDYVCSKPLPVIGLSILGLTLAIIRILAVTGIGRKSLKECKENLAQSKKAQEKTKDELLAFEERLDNKLDEFEKMHAEQMRRICSVIPNKNVQELGEQLYGRKQDNSEEATD